MDKQKETVLGESVYLLGVDKDDVYYWLREPEWSCGTYWHIGVIESYSNNVMPPSRMRDIKTNFFDELPLKNLECFKKFFIQTPFTDSEISKICELMSLAYIAQKYSNIIHFGGSNSVPYFINQIIKNKQEYDHINKQVIPAIMLELYNTLSPISNLEETDDKKPKTSFKLYGDTILFHGGTLRDFCEDINNFIIPIFGSSLKAEFNNKRIPLYQYDNTKTIFDRFCEALDM